MKKETKYKIGCFIGSTMYKLAFKYGATHYNCLQASLHGKQLFKVLINNELELYRVFYASDLEQDRKKYTGHEVSYLMF